MADRGIPGITRRSFVCSASGVVAGTALASRSIKAGTSQTVPQVVLGRTGASVSRLGIGCAPLQRPHVKERDIEELFYTALEHGVNYLDVAPNYGNERTGVL